MALPLNHFKIFDAWFVIGTGQTLRALKALDDVPVVTPDVSPAAWRFSVSALESATHCGADTLPVAAHSTPLISSRW